MKPEQSPSRILVVDDNSSIVSLLEALLTAEGYQVVTAADGQEALQRVEDELPDLILLDLELPFVDGYQVCGRLKQDPLTRLIPVVIITAQSSFQSKLDAWELGADDFLTKPFHAVEVVSRCRSLLRIKRLIEERESAEAVLFALARTVEAKSPYTHGHSERVRDLSLSLARGLGLRMEDLQVLRKGALLHDIGKISIPDSILNKPGPLTPGEYAVVKSHPEQGARIVEPLHSLRDALPLIRWHHERLDGHGYPDGLRGEAIPLLVRILSVADVYDSLSSERPYRPGLPGWKCAEIMRADADTGGLDPGLVSCFLSMLEAVPGQPVEAARVG